MSLVTAYGDQISQIEDLSQYISEYCEANNIDPSTYLSALDGRSVSEIFDDQTLQYYEQWTTMWLAYLLSGGGELYSEPASVEFSEEDLIQAYQNADQEMLALIDKILEDDPDLMAFYALQVRGAEESNSLLALLHAETGDSNSQNQNTSTFNPEYVNEEARELMRQYGQYEIEGLLDTTEGLTSAMQNIAIQLAEDDQTLMQIVEQFERGEISLDMKNAKMDSIAASREMKLLALQNVQNSLATVEKAWSQLFESRQEIEVLIANNMRSA